MKQIIFNDSLSQYKMLAMKELKFLVIILSLVIISSDCFSQDNIEYVSYKTSFYNNELKIISQKDPLGNEAGQTARLFITNLSEKAVKVEGIITAETYCGVSKSRHFKIHLNSSNGPRADYKGDYKCNVDLNVDEEVCKGKTIVSSGFSNGWKDRISNVTYQITSFAYGDPFTDLNGSSSSQSSETNHQMGEDGKYQQRQAEAQQNQIKEQQRQEAERKKEQSSQNQQQTRDLLDKATAASDGTMKAMYLSQAKINAMKEGGATPEQKQQIQQMEDEKNEKRKNDETKLANDIVDLATNLKFKKEKDFDPTNFDAGNYWFGFGVARPINSDINFRNYGISANLLAPIWGEHFQAAMDVEYTYYLSPNNTKAEHILKVQTGSITNTKTHGLLSVNIGWGPYLIKKKHAILVLQPIGGVNVFGDYSVTYKGKEYNSDNLLFSNRKSFIFCYGGYLRFYTNNFAFSLGYITNFEKEATFANSYGTELGGLMKAIIDESALKFTITYRLD